MFKKIFRQKLISNSGTAESISFIFGISCLLAVFYVLMMASTPLITKINAEATAKVLAREIEIHGAIDDEINQKAEELADNYGFEPEITYDATYIAGTDHIQIRDEFSVTVNTTKDIVLLDGTMFHPIKMTIPISAQRTGISEKLWK